MTDPQTTYDPDFTGQKLIDLVVGVESAVGGHAAGNTKLGSIIIRLCENAITEDEEAKRSQHS